MGDDVRGQKKLPKKITEKYLYNSASAYLMKFAASRAHLWKIMVRRIDRSCAVHEGLVKSDCLAMLERVVVVLERQGFLNEESALAGMVRSLRRRGVSQQLIQGKLLQKGFESKRIKQVLEEYDAEEGGEFTAALRFMRRKRIGCFGKGGEEKSRQKELMVFGRAGFSFDLARRVLELTIEEL